MKSIEVENLKKSFGSITANDDLSFSVCKGEIFGLLGPNGSGKTTCVNVLAGLLKKDEGTVSICGYDPIQAWKKVRNIIGLVPQQSCLYPELTGRQNLNFFAALFMKNLKNRRNKIEEILELVELTKRADTLVGTYSGGMKRRLTIGRALLHDPDFLFLDEPTLGVDVQGSHRIWEYIKQLAQADKTILLTTNRMGEADYLCDRLLILDYGKKIAQGTADELKKGLKSEEILIKKQPSLDEVFLHLTGRQLRD